MNLHLLYIDPGTGSALFAILIGAATTLYFVGRALIIKFKVVLSGGKAANVASSDHPFVIYCEGKQYWNVFKPVLDEFENRGVGLLYLTSAQDDPVFEGSWNFIKAKFIGEGNRAFAYLNFVSAKIVLMTTPGLDVYQLKRSKTVKHYSHIIHGTTDASMYRLFGLDYFDSVLLTGDYQAEDIRALETLRGLPEKKLVTVGCTYLDVYANNIKQIKKEEKHPFTILLSPSWGKISLLSVYGEKLMDPLVKTGRRVIIRPHPQSKLSEPEILERLEKRYSGENNIFWDYERENIYSLAKADIMISDFSGIIFDYTFLFDKPVIYVKQGVDLRPNDAGDLDYELWVFKTLREIGHELKEEDFNNIEDIINRLTDSAEHKAARHKAKSEAWQYPGESGKRTFDFMTGIVNNA
jgi:hypothetical protein